MQKIIMIRFSLRINRFERKAKILSEDDRNEWLQKRIKMFNEITYPSISQHDAHIGMFMANGDEWAYEQLKKNDNFIPIFTDNIEIKMISDKFLKDRFEKKESYILRLDSDDAIHKDFFDVDAPLNSFVVQPWGIKSNGIRNSTVHYPINSFVMSYSDTLLNPFSFQHTAIMRKAPFIVERDPMWFIGIHENNVMNGFNRNDVNWGPVDLSGFGL
jgi:hypothetical protein